MLLNLSLSFILLCIAAAAHAQTYTATYTPEDAPGHTQEGQAGTNKCGTGNSQDSLCQNAYSASPVYLEDSLCMTYAHIVFS
jgi:hypothetical protein